MPYFNRLPGGLVRGAVPRLSSDNTRFALEEATPSPTDVVGGVVGGPNATIPNVTKDRFNVNVVIESNDLLLHFRSDALGNLTNALSWLQGGNTLNGKAVASPNFHGLLSFQTPRRSPPSPETPRPC